MIYMYVEGPSDRLNVPAAISARSGVKGEEPSRRHLVDPITAGFGAGSRSFDYFVGFTAGDVTTLL